MKKIKRLLFGNLPTALGVILIMLSSTFFVCAEYINNKLWGVFFANYLLSVTYLVYVFFITIRKYGWRLSQGKVEHTTLLLILWFISAFALNKELSIFDNSVTWLCIWLVICCLAVVASTFHRFLPVKLKYFVFFLLGSALVLFVYYAVYLFPFYFISFIGIIVLGFSAHTFIPCFLCIICIVVINKARRINQKIIYFVIAGALLPLLACLLFLISWNNTSNAINSIINQSTLNNTNLPAWVKVSQNIKKSIVLERILKAGLVYHEGTYDNAFWGGMPSRSFNQPKQHDPLINVATLLLSKPNLGDDEKINILKSTYGARHQAQEQLWLGDDLKTISVVSNVKLFPEYRMAYTEKTLSICNNSRANWVQREAIYTFHLSEGSVVSSLSLWINGNEEKSRLTTKSKADSAYHQIVGVETHDPSVVHWQEGNTVTVRVFPCVTSENRKFRVGITSPLRIVQNRLIYDNPYFEGPDAANALETVQVGFSDKPKGVIVDSITTLNTDVYYLERTYKPDWNISLQAPPLANTGFEFAGSTYQISSYIPQYENFTPEKVYLDLNSAWTKPELDSIYNQVKDKPVFVFNNQLTRLTANNLNEIFSLMAKQNFSLLPVQKIDNPDNALIISKSGDITPNLSDLAGSKFSKSLSYYLQSRKNIRFYNIGNELTPYLKALKELRVLNYMGGTPQQLITLLQNNKFEKNTESDSTVIIKTAGIKIQRAVSNSSQSAPDHLLRLFAYNDMMKKIGCSYFNNQYATAEVITEAEKAYIASPVSSLIVLETQKDYQRFNIDENKNSLKNASMKSSGSVPEPHEWLLIMIVVICIFILIYRPKAFTKSF